VNEDSPGKAEGVCDTARFANLANTSRAAIDAAVSFGGADTPDVFTEVSRRLDKHVWFLRAHPTSFFGRDREHWRPATEK
jgi:hypothetical protein